MKTIQKRCISVPGMPGGNGMKIERNELLSVLSEALDHIETEVFGVEDHHAKRVAWLCLKMGKREGMSDSELSDLAVGALLHDNALNEYRNDYENGTLRQGVNGQAHCAAGEENLALIPGTGAMRGFVRYHHECADGSGPFGKTEGETPLGAQMIHIADEVDLRFSLGHCTSGFLDDIRHYLKENQGRLFGEHLSNCFMDVLDEECFKLLSDEQIGKLKLHIAPVWLDISEEGLYSVANLFARIIDYKSPFTRGHSVGVACKAKKMGEFYHYDQETLAKLYFAGALHDIGKLLVNRDVLEKKGRLDETEYRHIQSHAYETWRLLSKINGLGEVTEWASFHHEKLNGTGYPFGKTAGELNSQERLFTCLDIYQALTEDRPYKAGMSHTKAIGILKEMAEKGELDPEITAEIDQVFRNGDMEEKNLKTALFQCPVCGHIIEGDTVPDGYQCPVCGQPETAFIRIL